MKKDIVEHQSISFEGPKGSQEKLEEETPKFKSSGKKILDFATQKFMINSAKNYNNMKNNMLFECSKICFNNFTTSELTIGEKDCLDNCQHKYFYSYALSEQFSNNITEELKENKANENAKLTTILNNAQNKLS